MGCNARSQLQRLLAVTCSALGALQSLQAKLCQAVQHQLPGLCRWLTLGADVQRARVLGGLRPGCRCLLRSFVPG